MWVRSYFNSDEFNSCRVVQVGSTLQVWDDQVRVKAGGTVVFRRISYDLSFANQDEALQVRQLLDAEQQWRNVSSRARPNNTGLLPPKMFRRDLSLNPSATVNRLGFGGETMSTEIEPQTIRAGPGPERVAVRDGRMKVQWVAVPYWPFLLLGLVLPLLALARGLRSAIRHRAGLCPTCGYDL